MLPGISIVLATGALIVAIARRAPPTPGEVILRDPAGRERIRIAATTAGGVIELLDSQGRPRAALQEDADGVYFVLHPMDDHHEAVRLAVTERAGAYLELRDPRDRVRVTLGAHDGGGLSVAGQTYGMTLIATPISAMLHTWFEDQRGKIELNRGRSRIELGHDVSLVRSADGSRLSLGLGPTRRVLLSVDRFGGSVVVNGERLRGPAP